MQRKVSVIMALGVVVALGVVGAGCPQLTPENNARVLTVLSGDDDLSKTTPLYLETKQGPVPIGDIAAFWVTLTHITMKQDGGPDVQVFSGDPVDINLVDLMGVSSLLSAAEVPAGTYHQIRLHIANPELYLVDAPETPITDIHLTANDRLFVGGTFVVPEDQSSLLLVDFESMHLVEQGNGGFTLTPQLRAEVAVVDAELYLEGEIVAYDAQTGFVTVALAEGNVDVYVGDAAFYLSFDAYYDVTPDATEADLLVGASIWVEGLLQVDGTVQAGAVVFLN